MFMIELQYVAPIEKVDEVRNEHLEFLEKYVSKSIFLVSGPKLPRTGGLILADGITKDELDLIINEDPFVKKQMAKYKITEFTPTMGLFSSLAR
jgi:uncharacterized protein YciI